MVPTVPLPCVALLAGGFATRLGPIAARTPKLLVEVAGRPFFEHQLDLLRRARLTRIVICAGHLGEMIAERYGDGSRHGVSITYSFDGPAPLGTGGALRRALPLLGADCFVLYGDSYLPMDYGAAYDAFRASGRLALMTIYANEGRYERSNVEAAQGRILNYDKHRPTPAMRHIDYGLSLFSAAALARLPPGTSADLAQLQHELAQDGQLAAFEVNQRFYEIGTPAGLSELDHYLSLARPQKTS